MNLFWLLFRIMKITRPLGFGVGLVVILCVMIIGPGCGSICKKPDHSCPEPGHGPCFICDDPEYSWLRN